jgi:small-conductance mechanosensitive channel
VVFSSIVLSFTFAFGPTMQNVFDSVVWIFAVRAFDIGDHLQLGREEVFVEARSLGVLGTHMRRWDGGVFFVPNASLRSDMRIINVDRKERRSKPASMHGAAVEVRELLSLGAPPGFATKVVPGL